MKLLKFSVCFLCICTLSVVTVNSKVSAFTIDLFNEEQSAGDNRAKSGTFTDDSVTGSADIFGGDRFLSTTFSGGSGSRNTFNGIDIFEGTGAITAEAGATVGGYIEWNGISDSGSFIDLTDSGDSDSIKLTVVNVSETIDLEFIVEDADGTIGSLAKNVFDETPGDYYYSFSDFSSSGGTVAGLDFATADRVRMGTLGAVPPQLDLSFNLVESTAEVPFEFSPSLGLVLCGGLFGISKLKKKPKRINA